MNLGDLYVKAGYSMSIVFDQGTEELLLIVRRFIFSVGTNLFLYTKTVKEFVSLFFLIFLLQCKDGQVIGFLITII